MQEISDVPNNTGVLLEGTPNTEYVLTSKATASAVNGNNMLVANIGPFGLPSTVLKRTTGEHTNHILVSDSGRAKFGRTTGSGTLAGNKSFLQIPTEMLPSNASNARIAFGLFDDITGIDSPTTAPFQKGDGNMYDLQGRRVATLNVSKGVYIINGKKIVVR